MLFLGVYTLRAHAQCATGGQFAPTFRCQGAPRATLSMAFSAIAATRPPAWDRQGATGRLEKNTDIYKHVFHICFKTFSNEFQLRRWENISNKSHVGVVKHQPTQYIFPPFAQPIFQCAPCAPNHKTKIVACMLHASKTPKELPSSLPPMASTSRHFDLRCSQNKGWSIQNLQWLFQLFVDDSCKLKRLSQHGTSFDKKVGIPFQH